jgi:hypothetical protein
MVMENIWSETNQSTFYLSNAPNTTDLQLNIYLQALNHQCSLKNIPNKSQIKKQQIIKEQQ